MINIIKQYLAQHKRLVVPQLGTFIVKPDGGIVFSEMMRRDDGVLRSLIVARGGNELEAAGEIDRFVFEVRHAIESGAEYPLEGFGIMRPGANSTILFHHDTSTNSRAASAEETATPRRKAVPHTTIQRPTAKPVEKASERVTEIAAEHSAAKSGEPTTDTAREEKRDDETPSDRHLTDSVKMNPDPSVRGLRYGKPPKNTDAYSYVDKPVRRGGSGDIFMWIAVVVAAIALSAIAFGYWRDMQDRRVADQYFEEITIEETTAAEPQATELNQ